MNQAKLSRLETGLTRAKTEDIRTLCAVYGADVATTEHLVELVSAARMPQWWQSLVHPDRDAALVHYLESETDAHRIEAWAPAVVPPVVQTPDYARAMLTESRELTVEDVERRLELFTARRARVEHGDLDLWLVLGEGVVRCETGGAAALAEQLRYLASLASVTVQLLPFTTGVHRGWGKPPFQVLRFAGRVSGVYQDTLTDKSSYSDEIDVIEAAETTMTHIQADACSPRESRQMLLDRADGLRAL